MTTTADLIARTQRLLLSSVAERRNRLQAGVDATVETVSFDFDLNASGIGAGSRLGVDLEVMYVWSTAGSSATVERGFEGSTPAAHADRAAVMVNPRFSSFAVFDALNQDIASLWSTGLHRMAVTDLVSDPATIGYDLGATEIGEVWDVAYLAPGGMGEWVRITNYEFRPDVDDAAFPSGNALMIWSSVPAGQAIRVWYRAPFGALTSLTTDVENVVGMPASMVDIPPLGAAARLVVASEAKRNFTSAQPETRRADEVPTGSQIRTGQGFLALRAQRVGEELRALRRKYPVRSR